MKLKQLLNEIVVNNPSKGIYLNSIKEDYGDENTNIIDAIKDRGAIIADFSLNHEKTNTIFGVKLAEPFYVEYNYDDSKLYGGMYLGHLSEDVYSMVYNKLLKLEGLFISEEYIDMDGILEIYITDSTFPIFLDGIQIDGKEI